MKKFLSLFVILVISLSLSYIKANSFKAIELTTQIIKSEDADITGNGKAETVILSGVNVSGSPFYENIKITVSDNKTGTTLFSITPTTNFGYEPIIMVGDFTGDNVSEIFYGASSGNGEYGYYYLYCLGEEIKCLFDYESDFTSYNAVYDNWYKVKVFDDTTFKYLDVSNKKDSLSSIYNNGILNKEVKANITNVCRVSPCFNYDLNCYTLQVYRQITGFDSSEVYGYLVETYNYSNKEKYCTKNSFIAI